MPRLRPLLAAAALSLAACSESTAPEVTTVAVIPATASLGAPGATVQLNANAVGPGGTQVTGLTPTWASQDAGVATVSATGLVTAVAAGTTTVTATIQGITGTSTITVADPAPTCDDPIPVSLQVGSTTVIPTSECALLPSGAAGDRYRVAVLRPDSASEGDVVTMTLQVVGLGVTSPPRAAAASAIPVPDTPLRGPEWPDDPLTARLLAAQRRAHAVLRAQDEAILREALERGHRLARPPMSSSPAARAAALPERITYDAHFGDCTTTPGEVRPAFRLFENEVMAVYQDSAQAATAGEEVTPAQAARLAGYYAQFGIPVIQGYFGPPTDLDANGKIIALVAPAVEDFGGSAFVTSLDFLDPDDVDRPCPASNHGEYIYVGAEIMRLLDGVGASNGRPNYFALPTVVHEAKHVVSLYNRLQASIQADGSRYHPLWVEEGVAEIASEVSSRLAWSLAGGPARTERLDRQDFVEAVEEGQVPPYAWGTFLAMSRTLRYLSEQPHGLVVAPRGWNGADAGPYTAGFHFHRWLGDAYGNAAAGQEAGFFRALTGPDAPQGRAGIEQQTGKSLSTLLVEFVTAINLHETGAPQPPRAFTTYDFVTATDIFASQPPGQYPWPVTRTGEQITKTFASGSYTGPIGPTGFRIHDFVSNGTGTAARVSVNMPAAGLMVISRLR